MTVGLLVLAIVAVAVALLALRRSNKMQSELNQLKRDHYYTSSRLKRMSEEIREAVQPLRLQLAKVSTGGTVPRDMILRGQLYQDVTAAEVQRVLEQELPEQHEKVLLVDVRTPKEYAVRRVPGAKLVPFDELESRCKDEIPESAEKVFVYCMRGERSRSACDLLSQRGYTNLYNVQDGLQGWPGPTEGEGQVNLVRIERKDASAAP